MGGGGRGRRVQVLVGFQSAKILALPQYSKPCPLPLPLPNIQNLHTPMRKRIYKVFIIYCVRKAIVTIKINVSRGVLAMESEIRPICGTAYNIMGCPSPLAALSFSNSIKVHLLLV